VRSEAPEAHGMIGTMPGSIHDSHPERKGDLLRLYDYTEFEPAALAARRRRSVSVCIPALNEAATVGAIVTTVVEQFTAAGGGVDLVDELVVVDDGSTDATGAIACEAGATVVLPPGGGSGKGEAMRAAAQATTGDVVVFLDADVDPFPAQFVPGLLGPVLDHDALLVKASYGRPLAGVAGEGGRVNELVARPIISLLFPELSWVRQPLAGETAVARTVLDKVQLASGYGVEMALLIDVASLFGTGSIAQVELGERTHRNRSLAELGPQATDVLRIALQRASVVAEDGDSPLLRQLRQLRSELGQD
jgi:glucosyl-3-phosphoglycerate synthase